jgi:dihydropyrimidinase
MRFDCIVKNGMIVSQSDTVIADIGITGEKITAIGADLQSTNTNTRIVDAKGHFVIPGALDVHVHLELPFCGTVSADDYRSGTRAAARGGVTTVIDFAIPYRDDTLADAISNWKKKAADKALIDYSFHICITNWDKQQHEISEMIQMGVPTFKEFMIYESQGWKSEDRTIFCTLEKMKDLGGMLLVHAESASVLDELINRQHTQEKMKKHGASLHPLTRPNFIEAEAIQRAITWCEATNSRLYIVHMSTGEGADLVSAARNKGIDVIAETCPSYLTLQDDVFDLADGHLFATCPQIKKAVDNERLWRAIKEKDVSVIATDTCTFNKEQKAMWNGDFTKIPMGMPGLETMLPLVYTKGVLENRISIEEMVRVVSTAPAEIMGLAPRKGVIQIGADADLAVIHPEKRITVSHEQMETNCDWSPFEGWDLAGFSRTTISRGEIVVDDYAVCGKEGRGKWLERKLS